MQDTITRYASGIADVGDQTALLPILKAIGDRMSSQALGSAGLAVATTATSFKIANTTPYIAGGKHVTKAATDNIAFTTVFTITANSYNVACVFADAAGTITTVNGGEATTAAGVTFPQPLAGQAMLGYMLITHTSTFTANTTALSTATTVYVNTVGAVDPTILP